MNASARILQRIDELAALTDEPPGLCRTFLSPAMREANQLVGGWMEELGASVNVDGWGNLIGSFFTRAGGGATLLLGSHLDTVRNAGKYDGPLGVIVALEAVAELKRRGIELPYQLDVLGFSDEEGTRFQSAYLGSKAIAGQVGEADMDLKDAKGISIREAVAAFQNVPPEDLQLPIARYQSADLLGYVEGHIEQGPVLEDMDRPLGVVEHIAAQNRLVFLFEGVMGHAGTTPMKLRRDALAAAAEFVLLLEKMAHDTPSLVATVGQLDVQPGVSNVIPGRVRLSVDIRHANDEALRLATAQMHAQAKDLSTRRGITISSTLIQSTRAVQCAPHLVERLARAIDAQPGAVPRLTSGAGHDGVILSRLTNMGMIFVRCQDGLSHNPLESVTARDVSAACEALVRFLIQDL